MKEKSKAILGHQIHNKLYFSDDEKMIIIKEYL